MSPYRSARRGLAPLILLLLTACAGATMTANPELPYAPPRPPQVGDILHLPTGVLVSPEQMLAAAGDARLIYVGETHDNPASHRLQLQLLQALAERYPQGVALGMEMFTPAQQPVLDRWTAGELTEKAFLKESRWYEIWQMDFAFYRELLLFARDHKIPVLGLNAEKSLVRAIGRNQPAELPPEQQAQLPQLDLSDPYQKALVQSIFGGHSQGKQQLEGFLRVQTLWDETMAENVVRYLTSPQGEGRHLLVVAGGNHIRNGFGIPRRVFRRLPTSYVLIGSQEIDIPADKADRLMDVELPSFPMVPYDFLAFTAYEDLEHPEVKLGVLLDDSAGQVVAKGVMPDSAAARAGVQEGDVLLELDGEPLAENFDLIFAVKQKQPGDRATLRLRRGEAELTLEVDFTLPAKAE